MHIKTYKIDGTFNGKECFVHGRACAINEENLVMTMQKLNVAGSDDFSSLYVLKSCDGGKTWSTPQEESAFKIAANENGIRTVGCDAAHIFHKKTGTPIVIGHTASYAPNAVEPLKNTRRATFYTTYDIKSENYKPMKFIDVPEDACPGGFGSGSSQFIEEENGDLLIPGYAQEQGISKSAVIRCSFDGEFIKFKSISNFLSVDFGRGICEASICRFGGKYYLTLRNDDYGFWSVSDDGKTFSEQELWKWDTGDILPTYNTQSHWLLCGGKLYLVYTRKAGNNDHVFRHRAPLFMAEVDTERMCILRHTEIIVVPERGARLGNFGITQISDNKAIITACEWMQPAGCEKFGSDNSTFVTLVEC